MTDTGRKMNDKEIIKRLGLSIKPQRKKFIIAIILSLISVALGLVGPALIGYNVDILKADVIQKRMIILIIIVYLVTLLLSCFIDYFQTMTLEKAGQSIMYDVREEVFTHIEGLSIGQINEQPIGKLVTRVTSDTSALNDLFTNIIVNLIKCILTILCVIIIMFIYNPRLSLYLLPICFVVLIASLVFKFFSRRSYREVRGNISSINAFLSENLNGMKVTQIFNQEEKKKEEFKEKNSNLRKSSLKEIFIFAIFRPFIYILYLTSVIVILYIGGQFGIDGIITAGALMAFYQYLGRLFDPIQQLADQFNVIQSCFASCERIFEILDKKAEITDSADAVDLKEFKGEIEFKDVWFSYLPEEWILKGISFHIKPNETVAFVGATGSGKTTILQLIARNYDIQKGQILIDGIDIKRIKVSSLRKNIGQMLQDVFLFSGTVSSNIRMRDESITDEDTRKSCEYVNASHFIEKLPKQYEEEVRERGNNFSAGERQLISFARTVVHKPSIMILDEATANIDVETESLIQASLEKMMNIGTMLIVAHRLSTIQHSDNIIVLSKGEIKEMGNHQELLKKKGQYYNLYRLQFESKNK